jgi:hypothetical protein
MAAEVVAAFLHRAQPGRQHGAAAAWEQQRRQRRTQQQRRRIDQQQQVDQQLPVCLMDSRRGWMTDDGTSSRGVNHVLNVFDTRIF